MSRRSNLATAEAARLFAALGDRTRLQLVARLCSDGPQSIASLRAGSSVSRQGVTKHLDALAAAGLLRDSRRGRERIFHLAPGKLETARRTLDLISRQWDDALSRLQALVEE